jgi:uncharacterized protein (DUF433 family)
MAELNAALPEFLTAARGEVRLTGHRINLFSVLRLYQEGYSAEALAARFPTVSLAVIHKIIAFYLENQEVVDVYVSQYGEELAELERQNPTRITTQMLRDRLAKMHSHVAGR